jgi:hypothetical protein
VAILAVITDMAMGLEPIQTTAKKTWASLLILGLKPTVRSEVFYAVLQIFINFFTKS